MMRLFIRRRRLHPPRREEAVDAVLVAHVVVVGRGEYLALAHGATLDGVLRERGGDRLQPLGERLARVLHADVGRGEAAAPCRTFGDCAVALRAALDGVYQGYDQHEQPSRQRDAPQSGRHVVLDGLRGRGYELLGDAAHHAQGVLGQQAYRDDSRHGDSHGGYAAVVDLVGFGHMVVARRAEEYGAVEFCESQHRDAAYEGQGHEAARGA